MSYSIFSTTRNSERRASRIFSSCRLIDHSYMVLLISHSSTQYSIVTPDFFDRILHVTHLSCFVKSPTFTFHDISTVTHEHNIKSESELQLLYIVDYK